MTKPNPFAAGTEPAAPAPSLLRALHRCNPRLAQREYDRWQETRVDAAMREAAWISAHAASDEDEAAQIEALLDRVAWITSEGISPEWKRRTWAAMETMTRLRERHAVAPTAVRAVRRTCGSSGRPAGRARRTASTRAGPDDPPGEPGPPPRGHLPDVAAVHRGRRP